ncbi:MAG: glycosyl hydrolase family 30 [Muribaculaceae bacterium]|nr:glycosyl hydrolase family 30 [Muribaculaceae bacterium]
MCDNILKINLSLFLLFAWLQGSAKVEWHSSVENNYWIKEKQPVLSKQQSKGSKLIKVTDQKAQKIDGLGGTFNEIGWDMLCLLDESARNKVFYELFSPEESNYSYCRMPVGASDYALNYYSLNDVADDFDMINFSVDRDRHILMKYIKAAQTVRPDLKIWASPWSPPAWMKTNNHYASSIDNDEINHNGLPDHLEQELPCTGFKMQKRYLEAYAKYFVEFVNAYSNNGIEISALNVQNEPCSTQKYASCVWRPEDLAYFIGNFLGPEFEREGIPTEIYFGTINRDNPEFTRVALNYPPAAKFLAGAGFQWDGKGAIPYISKEYPNLKMMHTEAECGNGSNDWDAAEHTWWQMVHYLTNGACVFTYWNMVLDNEGVSPWGWKQNALISIDKDKKEVRYNPEFYLMKHLCHAVNPGDYRLETQGDNDILAFNNSQGKTTVVLVNRENIEKQVSLKVGNEYLNIILKPKSFNTFEIC